MVNLQVTDAKEKTIEIRVLVTASDSSKAWDLRCEMREKLIGYIQSEFPEALPRYRGEIVAAPGAAARAGGDGLSAPVRARDTSCAARD